MKKNILVIILFIIIGCSENLPKNPLEHFPTTISLKASKVVNIEKFNIFSPTEVILYKDWYIFKDKHDKKALLKCLSIDFTKILSGLCEGNGPLDIVGLYSIEKSNDVLYIKDPNHLKLLSVDIKDSLLLREELHGLSFETGSRIINNNRFIMLDNITDSVISFLSLVDTNKIVYSNLDFPEIENTINLDSAQKWGLFLNTELAISPNKDKFAWGCTFVSSFGFGEINHDSLIIINEFGYTPADYSLLQDIAIPNKDALFNVKSSVGTNKYAIFLYSGRKYESLYPFGKSLLFYTWQGEPIKRIDVDYDLSYINYDKKRNVLYCIAQTPEAVLVEYDMNGIIE